MGDPSYKIMSSLSLNVSIIKCVILLVLLLPLPLNGNSLTSGGLDPSSNAPTDASQHIYRRMTDGNFRIFYFFELVFFSLRQISIFSNFVDIFSVFSNFVDKFPFRNHFNRFLCVLLYVLFHFHLERYAHDKVINTVLNINDSNAAEVLNIFNVSKDDVLRRIESFSQSQPNNLNSRPHNVDRHTAHELSSSATNDSTRPGIDSEKE